MKLCLQIELAEEKSHTSLTEVIAVSLTNVRLYATKEKKFYSECYKKFFYAGPKSARNISANLSPKPGRTRKNQPDFQL